MEKHRYKMTVIMPSYNNGQYIKQALDSVLHQKVNFNYQVIITDDCSQDDSIQIIKEYEKKYPEKILALYSAENCRLFRNMLKALEKMDSEYFCVLDPDDYWSDMERLQKAVDFLDKNLDYTIYATNLHILYNDGSTEIKYKHPEMKTCTSTYEDYLHGKAVLSTTAASTYRNVYFANGIPEEYHNLLGTQFEEAFRADSARNLLHLTRGKAYFLNESIGYYRYHGNGLSSGKSEYERYIWGGYARIGFWDFLGRKNSEEYKKVIKYAYTQVIKTYFLVLASGRIPELSETDKSYLKTILEWLELHDTETGVRRIPFSLKKFSELWEKKVYIWGTGTGARKTIEKYGIPVGGNTFFVDNNSEKQGKEFMGRLVKDPESIRSEKDCLVVIASSYYKEIIEQIREQELCEDGKVVNVYDYKENWIG